SQPTAILQAAFIQASQAIIAQSGNDPEKQGMGTTCVCAWIIGKRLYVASVGNSRLYLVRGSQMFQMTVDHTWVQEAWDAGIINSEEARSHPRRHLIRSYLGSADPLTPDLRLYLSDNENLEQAKANQGLPLLPQDQILICTDGLTDLVIDEEILDIINRNDSKEEQLGKLVDLANLRGGHDNITIVLLQPPGEELFEE
ncbi:MAG: serine/threonine-protein phosphatase, partial [Anaerolineales bacterium]|nr:serine/threonine-protein phosphatase [Anaerolineales bacterium]